MSVSHQKRLGIHKGIFVLPANLHAATAASRVPILNENDHGLVDTVSDSGSRCTVAFIKSNTCHADPWNVEQILQARLFDISFYRSCPILALSYEVHLTSGRFCKV